MNEDESISCNCFNDPITNSTSGLKPSKLVFSQSSVFLSNPKHTKSISKVDQFEGNKIKTSLKRQKPSIPPISSIIQTPSFTAPPSPQNKNMNYQMFTLKQPQPIVTQIFKLQQGLVNFGQQKINYVKKESFYFQERNEQIGKQLVRKNVKPIIGNCSAVSKLANQQPTKINIKYENQISLQSSKGPYFHSQFQIPSENRISKVEESHIERPTGKSRRSSSSTQKGYRKDRPSMTPRQPFKMVLKQIESMVDENDLHDDISEVIGRGWDQDDSFDFVKEKQFANETRTHPTSASNIKNSSLESGFGGNSHLQSFN